MQGKAQRRAVIPAGSNTEVVPAGTAIPSAIRAKGVRTRRAKSDGLRVLVTRHAPYKVKKSSYDEWYSDLAPSSALLRRHQRGEIGREGFDREYMNELRENGAAYDTVRDLRAKLRSTRITLLFDTRDGRGHDLRSVPRYHLDLLRIVERPEQIRPKNAAARPAAPPSLKPDEALRSRLTKGEIDLYKQIMKHMTESGFTVNPHLKPERYTAEAYRKIQRRARDEQILSGRDFLSSALEKARESCPDGADIDPARISLKIKEVLAGEPEEKLFRWWNLVWWSMPYQKAYGRQMRFLLWDEGHDAPFGLVSLQSPLLRMGVRDRYLSIPSEEVDYWANMSMSAQRVGALPPYNGLMGGKMAALSMTSNKVRDMYRHKYKDRITSLYKRVIEPKLLFVTTTSAFGASSMYDRLTYRKCLAAIPMGYTRGEGTFHLPDDLTRKMYTLMKKRGINTSTTYGNGPSRKLAIFKESFRLLGLSGFQRHGIRRQVYLFPLATNLPNVIQKHKRPLWANRPLADIVEYWKERWAIARSTRVPRWRDFRASEYFDEVSSLLGRG